MMAAGCEGSANFGTAATMPETSPKAQATETKGDVDAPAGVECSQLEIILCVSFPHCGLLALFFVASQFYDSTLYLNLSFA